MTWSPPAKEVTRGGIAGGMPITDIIAVARAPSIELIARLAGICGECRNIASGADLLFSNRSVA